MKEKKEESIHYEKRQREIERETKREREDLLKRLQ